MTLLVGPQLETDMEQVYGLKNFKPAYRYDYGNSFFVGGALSYRLLGNAEVASIEGEVGVGQRFGSIHQTEGWVALYARWSYFSLEHDTAHHRRDFDPAELWVECNSA